MGKRWGKSREAKATLKFVIPAKAGIQKKRKIGLPKLVDSDKIKKLGTGLRRYDDKNYDNKTN
jgi:hypothetical protein